MVWEGEARGETLGGEWQGDGAGVSCIWLGEEEPTSQWASLPPFLGQAGHSEAQPQAPAGKGQLLCSTQTREPRAAVVWSPDTGL